MSSAAFAELVASYYPAWFRYHPEAAVEIGVAGYAHLLAPFRDEDIGALLCLNDELRVALEELDSASLTPDERIDRDVLYGSVLLENQHLLEVETRSPDPARVLPNQAIYQLTIRPVEDFEPALRSRLGAIPAHLEDAREHFRVRARAIPPLWLESAVVAARRGADFMHALPAHPRVAALGAQDTLGPAVAAAAQALVAYAEFLERELAPQAQGDIAAGAAYFTNLMRYQHFLDVEPAELRALGERLFRQTERDLKDTCRNLYGHEDLAAATRAIQANHPPAGELLEVYRREMRAAREFIARHGLVTLPVSERLDVVETPVFMRHQVPFAAYHEPAANDPTQHGYYYVTPPEGEAQLAEHNFAGLMHTCVHEAYPGHHLQFVTANLTPAARTLPRLLRPSSTLYEGWALYCEQLMHEQGFLDRPEQRFILLKDRLWRVLRILIDVDIHTQGVNVEEAAERLVTHLGFPRAQAQAELRWYTHSPTAPMGYATGWALINALRDRARLAGRAFDLKHFHDRLLSAGSIALPLVIRRVFGADMWASVRQMVFGVPEGRDA